MGVAKGAAFGKGGRGFWESDEMLAAEAASGRMEALGKIYERYSRPLYNFVARMIGDASQAEDVVHDVFVSLPAKARSFSGKSAFSTWLYALATNAARMQLRKAAARKERPMNGVEERRAAEGEDPIEAADRREKVRRVREALGKLTETEREAFLLYWYQGLAYDEIAQALDINVGAARLRVHRAHARLADLLGA